MFRKVMASVALAFCAATAFAGQTTIDTSGLSEAQIAEIKAITADKVAKTAANQAKPAEAKPETITAGVALAATWGSQLSQAAEGFARALGIAAKELNVTINEFITSPAGILTAAVIIWKVAGATLIKMVYGTIFLTVGLTMVRILYTRLFVKEMKEVQYSYLWGLKTGTKMVRVPKSVGDLRTDGEWMTFWVMIILTALTIVVGSTFF